MGVEVTIEVALYEGGWFEEDELVVGGHGGLLQGQLALGFNDIDLLHKNDVDSFTVLSSLLYYFGFFLTYVNTLKAWRISHYN